MRGISTCDMTKPNPNLSFIPIFTFMSNLFRQEQCGDSDRELENLVNASSKTSPPDLFMLFTGCCFYCFKDCWGSKTVKFQTKFSLSRWDKLAKRVRLTKKRRKKVNKTSWGGHSFLLGLIKNYVRCNGLLLLLLIFAPFTYFLVFHAESRCVLRIQRINFRCGA